MLDSQVLVLNRVFQAVQVTSVRKAFSLFYKGHVKAVLPDYSTYEFENWCDIPVQPQDEVVLTPSMAIRVPARRRAQGLRPPAAAGREVLAPQHLPARREPLPVLRAQVRVLGAVARPRDPALARRQLVLGERRVRVPLLQRAQGQPHAAGGRTCGWSPPPKKPRWHPVGQFGSSQFHPAWRNFVDVAYWNTELK